MEWRTFIWREGDEYFQQKSDKFLKVDKHTVRRDPTASIKNIYYVDLSKGPRFSNNTFDAVNAYHVLEHLMPHGGRNLWPNIPRQNPTNFACQSPIAEHLSNICQLGIASENPTCNIYSRYQWSVMSLRTMVREKLRNDVGFLRGGNYDREYLERTFGDCFRPLIEIAQQTEFEAEPIIWTEKHFAVA
jgi:hypothetical protein